MLAPCNYPKIIDFIEAYFRSLDFTPQDEFDRDLVIEGLIAALSTIPDYADFQDDVDTAMALCYNACDWLRHWAPPPLSPMPTGICHLLSGPSQPAQRSPEWYSQTYNMLTASEIKALDGTPAARHRLFSSKVLHASTPCAPPAAVLVTSSLTHGQRYEPVVKLILQASEPNLTLHEFGRIPHPSQPRVGASPDAVAVSSTGAYNVEIKSVTSRQIDGRVSQQYYYQMQLQMQCLGLPSTRFIETKFEETYDPATLPQDRAWYGWISIVSNPDMSLSYDYGPPCAQLPLPQPPNRAAVIVTVYWSLAVWHEQWIYANPRWWNYIRPLIEKIWQDVDGCREAIAGEAATFTEEQAAEGEEFDFVPTIEGTTP